MPNRTLVAILTVAFMAPDAGAAPPTPKALLTDAKARAEFAATYVRAMVLVHYHPPLSPGQDPKYRTPRQVRAFAVDDGGVTKVLAPTGHLLGATSVSLELHDGRRLAAKVRPPVGDPREIPLVELEVEQPNGLTGVVPLQWAADDKAVSGLRLWGVELSAVVMPRRGRTPAIIDASVGKAVEYPLERFFYSGVGGIDGQPLLTHQGRVACVVFRRVPGTRNISLCAPRSAALTVPARKSPEAGTWKLDTYGRKPLER